MSSSRRAFTLSRSARTGDVAAATPWRSPEASAVSCEAARRRILAQCRIEVGFPQCCYAAAGIEERLLDLIGGRVLASCLLQLRRRRALQIEEAATFLRVAGSGDRLLLRRPMCRQPCAERTERRDKDEHDGTRHHLSGLSC